jgi:hypothetical protein
MTRMSTMLHHDPSASTIRRHPTLRPKLAGVRRHDRKEATLHVLIQDEHGWETPLEATNISPTGVFIRSSYLFELGQVHRLIISSPITNEWVALRARVVRVELGRRPDELPGMAYEFILDAAHTQDALCDLVASI